MSYSFSSLQTYKKCPLQYCYENFDKKPKDGEKNNLSLVLGICVHKTLEDLYKKVNDCLTPEEKECENFFDMTWKEKIAPLIEAYPINETELNSYYDRGIRYIKYYYEKYKPFHHGVPMKMEERVNFEIEEGILFRGQIDRIDINDGNLIINDYKTSRSLPKDSDNTIEDQITLYAIGVKEKYGKQVDKIIGNVIYLHLEFNHDWEITDEKINQTKEKYLSLIKEIEDKEEQYNKGNKEAFETKPGYACDDCLFHRYCPIYKHQYMDDEEWAVGDLKPETIKRLIAESAELSEKRKAIDTVLKNINSTLADYAKEKGCKRLYGDNKKVNIAEKITYSAKEGCDGVLESKLKDMGIFEDVQSINNNRLGDKFKKNELDFDDFNEIVKKSDTYYVHSIVDLKKDEEGLDLCGDET